MLGCLVALDRSGDDGGPRGIGAGREFGPGRDFSVPVPVRPIEAAAPVRRAESRSRAECYEALRAADGTPREACEADGGSDRGGWDEVDATDRPAAEDIRITPERTTHILDGDGAGGGHRHGTDKPGKTEFPASWDDEKTVDAIVDVARRPDQQPTHQEWNNRWVARGTRDGVGIVAVVASDGRIWTSWPTADSPGVTKNPEEP